MSGAILFLFMKNFFRNNSLTIVFSLMFVISFFLQSITGFRQYNQKQQEAGAAKISYGHYFSTGHFIEATFENWESEFLQMAMFVTLSMFLYQKGSSQSKDPDKKAEVESESAPKRRKAPWPVKKGGFVLSLYKYSLGYALFLLFILSFLMHWYGSLKGYNHQQMLKGLNTQTAFEYLTNSKLWFESFENWQSEFLSIVSLSVLSIFFRQKDSPQSKPVDAPDSKTGA